MNHNMIDVIVSGHINERSLEAGDFYILSGNVEIKHVFNLDVAINEPLGKRIHNVRGACTVAKELTGTGFEVQVVHFDRRHDM